MKYIILLLLLMPIVSAYDAGTTIETFILPLCYGEATVLVDPDNRTAFGDYEIVGCTETKLYLWSCKCNGPTSIYLKSPNTTKNIYNLKVQYYIARPTTEDMDIASPQSNMRLNMKRVVVGLDPPKPIVVKPFKWPEIGNTIKTIIAIVIFIVAAIIVGMIYMAIKFLFGDDDNKIEAPSKPVEEIVPYKIEPKNDDELDKYLKGL